MLKLERKLIGLAIFILNCFPEDIQYKIIPNSESDVWELQLYMSSEQRNSFDELFKEITKDVRPATNSECMYLEECFTFDESYRYYHYCFEDINRKNLAWFISYSSKEDKINGFLEFDIGNSKVQYYMLC